MNPFRDKFDNAVREFLDLYSRFSKIELSPIGGGNQPFAARYNRLITDITYLKYPHALTDNSLHLKHYLIGVLKFKDLEKFYPFYTSEIRDEHIKHINKSVEKLYEYCDGKTSDNSEIIVRNYNIIFSDNLQSDFDVIEKIHEKSLRFIELVEYILAMIHGKPTKVTL